MNKNKYIYIILSGVTTLEETIKKMEDKIKEMETLSAEKEDTFRKEKIEIEKKVRAWGFMVSGMYCHSCLPNVIIIFKVLWLFCLIMNVCICVVFECESVILSAAYTVVIVLC